MGLMWLRDLSLRNPHHIRLSEKVHAAWDLAESNNQQVSIMNCINIARSHWQKVRETMLTTGQGNGGGTKMTNDPPTDPTNPPKKKRKKNKKGKEANTNGVAAAATRDKTLPP